MSGDLDSPFHWNAWVDGARGDWLGFAYGYREVATRAWQHLKAHSGFANPEIFAFCFLWRHYLELTLKALLQVCDVPDEDRREQLLEQHELQPIWEALRPTLTAQTWWSESQEDMGLIEQTIMDFQILDKGSFDFRYPANKDRTKTSLQDAPEHINAARLNDWMIWVADELDATFDALTCGKGRVRVFDDDNIRGKRVRRRKKKRRPWSVKIRLFLRTVIRLLTKQTDASQT